MATPGNEIVSKTRPRRQTILRLLSASVASTSPFRWHYSRWRHCWGSTIGRTGIAWASDGPQAGYFPFYLAVILAAASLYGLIGSLVSGAGAATTFVTRDQLRRVMQVFVPTLLFCLFTQWLGLYVASFLLIAGFMRLVGRIALWKSLLTAFLFAIAMFATFDLAFDVIMPKGPLEAALGY